MAFIIPETQQAVTMFNMSTLLNQKDSRWLQLEVCRENQRQKCTRSDADCKFAHPPTNVEVQNGRVTACYDSIKVGHFPHPLNFVHRIALCKRYENNFSNNFLSGDS